MNILEMVNKAKVMLYDKKLKNRASIIDLMYTPEQQAEMRKKMTEYHDACDLIKIIVKMYNIDPADIFED